MIECTCPTEKMPFGRCCSGATRKLRRMSITVTTPKLFAEFSATDATPFLACAKTTTSCFRLWRGI